MLNRFCWGCVIAPTRTTAQLPCLHHFSSGTTIINQRSWQFDYGVSFTKNATFSTAVRRVSDVIKNVRTIFGISDIRLLDGLCDAKTEGKMMSEKSARDGSGEKSRLTPSIVTKLPIREMLFLTWREGERGAENCGKLLQKEKMTRM